MQTEDEEFDTVTITITPGIFLLVHTILSIEEGQNVEEEKVANAIEGALEYLTSDEHTVN